MWAAKVDRTDEAAGEDAPQTTAEESTAATEGENAATASKRLGAEGIRS